jgi:hypothetical protein
MLDYIPDTAVLEFGLVETLSPIGAISPAYTRLRRPGHLLPWPDTREKAVFSTVACYLSRERRTVCRREMDSNFQFRAR